MYNSSTDAYQDASKIMSHEYANKYANYWSKKNKTIKSGKANFKDSGRQKTYNAEFKALREMRNHIHEHDDAYHAKKLQQLDWKGSQKLFKKIAKSATYKKLCENEVGSTKKSTNCSLVKKKFRGATAGRATWYGAMELQENNCPYTNFQNKYYHSSINYLTMFLVNLIQILEKIIQKQCISTNTCISRH